jgi:hypothetical protein
MVTQHLLPIGYSYGNRLYIPVLKFIKYQYFITNKTDKSLFFLLGLVAMILYWYSGNQNIE